MKNAMARRSFSSSIREIQSKKRYEVAFDRSRMFAPVADRLEERLLLDRKQVAAILPQAAEIVRFRTRQADRSLEILATSGADKVEIGRNARGMLTVTVNGRLYSSDQRDRGSFDRRLAGLRPQSVQSVLLSGDDPFDTVILSTTLGGSRTAAEVRSQSVTIATPVIQSGVMRIDAQSITISAPVQAESIVLSAKGLLNIESGGSLKASRSIELKADRLIQAGGIEASAVSLAVNTAIRSGTILAPGGSVEVRFAENYVATQAAAIDVSSAIGSGGSIRIDGGLSGHFFSSGMLQAKGGSAGGEIRASGKDVVWVGGGADASGAVAGGLVHIGGGWQGGDSTMTPAGSLAASPDTRFSADGAVTGGTVVLWSEESTKNLARISAKGAAGGAVEISSKADLIHGGVVDVGPGGRLLLDPKNIVIADNVMGGVPMFELVNPTPNANDNFGNAIIPLSSGNVVVTDPGDDSVATNAGAVFLYDGTTGALIGALTGSSANDQIGGSGVTALTNGNYVVPSSSWDNGSTLNVGAVTWGSGISGVSGAVSASNSLVGTTASDQVGIGGVTALSNGNYVVSSYYWDNSPATDVGAVTWGDGAAGTKGAVSVANSLVGSTTFDQVGLVVTALSNGNYVVRSYNWDKGGVINAGAVTWCIGTAATVGSVSVSNSLTGSTTSDQVGFGGLTELSNGNYVVINYYWDNGGFTDVGAVTWCSGVSVTSSAVSASNSFIGSKVNDQVGIGGVTALSNGNYVVRSYAWDFGGIVDAGAVTWGNGTTGSSGAVSDSNSLVGSSAFDQVGSQSVAGLANGNYVVLSPQWDNGATTNVGAATWADGTVGISGTISSSNSLIGSASSDQVGNAGIRELTSGNYVVISQAWNGSRGAVTWANGGAGITGVVSSSNSLVGSTAFDSVGGVVALTNGQYVVVSPSWDNGAVSNVGAVTWGNGTTGISGAVSVSNSLVGSTASDQVGNGGVTALTNGHYIVSSTAWDNGAIVDAGAVTWVNGTAGTIGTVSVSNSLYGSTASDQVGSGVTALSGGNYVVRSPNWDNGAIANAGAVTFASGTTGTSAAVSSTNSLVGSTSLDQIGFTGLTVLSSGGYLVRSQYWDNGANLDSGALTWLAGTSGAALTGLAGGTLSTENSIAGIGSNAPVEDKVTGTYVIRRSTGGGAVYVGLATPLPNGVTFASTSRATSNMSPAFVAASLSAGTATTLQANGDIALSNALTANNPGGAGGTLTLSAGRSVNFAASVTTDNGGLSVIANAPAASGVVDSQRDAGAASVVVISGVTIDAGNGAVALSTGAATGLTNRTSGGVTIAGTVSGGSVSIATADSGSGTPAVALSGSILSNGAGGIAVNSAGPVNFGINGTLASSASSAAIAVTGSAISLRNAISTNNGNATFTGPVTIAGTFVATTGSGILAFANGLSVSSLAVTFESTVAATVARTLSLNGGVILANTGGVSVGSSGLLTGHGLITGPVTVAGRLAPGSGDSETGNGLLNFASGSLALAATSVVSMNGISKSAFDKVLSSGASLAGAVLSLDLSNVSLNPGDSITLIDNVSGSAISGTFAGMAQGALFTANGNTMQISYLGGDGNDVTVTKVGDITADFSVARSGFFYVIANDTYRQTITLTNLTPSVKKPKSLKFVGLPAEVRVVGGTQSGSDWYLNVEDASVPSGGALGLPVYFEVPSGRAFNYSLEVLGG